MTGQFVDGSSRPGDLQQSWQLALIGNSDAQTLWQTDTEGRWGQTDTGGKWQWQKEGLAVEGTGKEWSSISWQLLSAQTLKLFTSFAIELTISGHGGAAGISFGDFKDFLAQLGDRPQRIRLEVNARTGYWGFFVEGKLAERHWWNTAVHGVDDLVNGVFALKGRYVNKVIFQNLSFLPLQGTSCQLSIILTCYRFLQRLRITLRNWCYQTAPFEAYELLVVNPGNLDGTHEYLEAVKHSYPELNLHEIEYAAAQAINKGSMINEAFRESHGQWIWLADADCLFPPTSIGRVLSQIEGRKQFIHYCERRHLSAELTNNLLAGRMDGLRDFETLSKSSIAKNIDKAPWGYTQIIHRSTLAQTPYPETFDHFAHSDSHFVKLCQRHQIFPKEIEGLFCLHLDHPFAWFGTDRFL